MKKKMIFIWLLMLGTLTSCQSCSSEYKNVNEIIVEELEIPVPLGDMGHRTKRFFQWSGKMGERF